MTTHSKGSYVAYRSGRNALTYKQKVFRERMKAVEESKRYCEEPFPNGACIQLDENKSVYENGAFVHKMGASS